MYSIWQNSDVIPSGAWSDFCWNLVFFFFICSRIYKLLSSRYRQLWWWGAPSCHAPDVCYIAPGDAPDNVDGDPVVVDALSDGDKALDDADVAILNTQGLVPFGFGILLQFWL